MSPRKEVHVHKQIHVRQNPRNCVSMKMYFLKNPQTLMLTKYNDVTEILYTHATVGNMKYAANIATDQPTHTLWLI